MNKGYNAVNYCHTRSLYIHGCTQAQHRADINGTTELVLYIENDKIVDEITVRPSREIPHMVRNSWL